MLNSYSKSRTLIMITSLAIAFSQGFDLDSLAYWELHGPVHTVIEHTIDIEQKEGQSIETPRPVWSQKTFDEQGRLMENIVYRDDVVIRRVTLTYNDAGQLAETIFYLGDSIDYIETKVYDESGNWIKTIDERNGVQTIIHLNSDYLDFDPLKLKSNGDLRVFTFNDLGKPVERAVYRTDYGLVSKTIFSYNEQGDLVEESLFDGKTGKLAENDKYIVENGLVVANFHEQYELGTYLKQIYEYDEYGNILVDTRQSKRTEGYGSGLSDYYSYDYDSQGNWLKKVYPELGGSIQVTIREITYY